MLFVRRCLLCGESWDIGISKYIIVSVSKGGALFPPAWLLRRARDSAADIEREGERERERKRERKREREKERKRER